MARTSELPSEAGEVSEDGSSLMLCSPLIPQRDSLVEIAETEYVSFNEAGQLIAESHRSPLYQAHTVDDVDEESEVDGDERRDEMRQTVVGSSQTAEGTSVENDAVDGEGRPSDASGIEARSIFRWPWSKTEEEKHAQQKAKKQAEAKAREERNLKKLMWVPSPTKISLQTMWWGYRMSVNTQTDGSVANWLSFPVTSLHPSSRC